MPHSESILASLLAILVRVTRARRVLSIGTGSSTTALAIADALPDDGLLITLEGDVALGNTARQTLADAGHSQNVSVIIAEASRYLHKVAGPFDLVVQNGDPERFGTLHGRLVGLLAVSGILITHKLSRAGSYNETLGGDPRLQTTMMTEADLAVSIRRENQS